MKLFFLSFSALLLSSFVQVRAQGLLKLYDIHPVNTGAVAGSEPSMFTEYKGKLYFNATDSAHGRELMSMDAWGNISVVADITPGANGMYRYGNHNAKNFVITDNIEGRPGNVLYFIADDPNKGRELFLHDGANTMLAAEFEPGTAGLDYESYGRLDTCLGEIYIGDVKKIRRFDPVSGAIKTINAPSPVFRFTDMRSYKGKLYLAAQNSELFCYDPIADKLERVFGSLIGQGEFTVLNSMLYFRGRSSVGAAQQLYAYNGINPPKEISPIEDAGSHIGMPGMALYNGKIYYGAPGATPGLTELTEYDPATNKTTAVAATNPKGSAACRGFFQQQGKLFFLAVPLTHRIGIYEYDGSTVSMLYDLSNAGLGNIDFPYIFAGNLYFSAMGTKGIELYRYTDAKLSIQKAAFTGDVSIYPNPAATNATVAIALKEPANLTLVVTDATGRQIWQIPATTYPAGKTNLNINVTGYASGMYYLGLTGTDGTLVYSGKLVKQ